MTRSGTTPLPPDGAVVVVGAGLGGVRAAEALRSRGFKGRVTLVGDEDHPPYDRPPLTKQFLAGAWEEERIALVRTPSLVELGIEHRSGVPASALDVAARRVTLGDGTELDADGVVLATGAAPMWLPGTRGAAGVHVVRTLEDARTLRAAFATLSADEPVVVIGGGFIGAEVASTAAGLGIHAVILEQLEVPLSPVVGDEVGRWLVELHARAGVEVRAGVGVTSVTGRTPTSGPIVTLANGEQLAAGVVVIGIGVRPTTAWLDGSGLELADGVRTDASLFAADGIVAVGDLARFTWQHAGIEEEVRIEHWEVTTQLASHAADALLAGRGAALPVDLVPYFWSDQHGRKLQVLGRPTGTDAWVQVAGSLDEGKFTFLYHRGGVLTGVLGVASPRNVMRCRTLVEQAAPLAEARALFDGAAPTGS